MCIAMLISKLVKGSKDKQATEGQNQQNHGRGPEGREMNQQGPGNTVQYPINTPGGAV